MKKYNGKPMAKNINGLTQPFSNRFFAFLALISLGLLSVNAQAQESKVIIGALASGQVTNVYVKEGDQVKKGDKLLTLDAERYQAKMAMLKAQQQMAKVTLDDAKIELDQALDLYDRTVTSKRTLDASQLRYDQAKAGYNKAKAEVQLHRAWAKYVYIKSPINALLKFRIKDFTAAPS